MPTEDLAHTPAERAAAEAAAKKPRVEEADVFASAEEQTLGASDNGEQHIVVLGAGLVGALCAVVLLRKGFKVTVFERYQDIRSIPSLGRSINLSVTSRGLRAIRALGGGFYDEILDQLCTRIRGRIIHMPSGEVVFQRYGKDDTECNYSISRLDLNKYLINVAAQNGAEFHFGHQLSDTSDFSGDELVGCKLNFSCQKYEGGVPSGSAQHLRFRVLCPVIACDGAGSRARYALNRSGLTTFTEDIIPRGYKEVLFPNPGENDFGAKGEDGSEPCHGRYGLHIWPRGEHMLMALSNRDGSFTGTIYMDNKGPEDSFEAFSDTPEGREKCAAFCQKHYAKALPYVGGLESMVRQITTNPTGILGTVRTATWAVRGKVILLGDSCHAMVPFFGQGCNCGFEDTLWLSKLLDKHCCRDGKCVPELCTGENFAACFAALEKERKPNAEAICDMALENFVEMRDKTGDLRFQALKKVENKLENTFPDKIRSRYAMVCYGGEGNVSYANAKSLGMVQWDILEQLLGPAADTDDLGKAVDQIDMQKAEKLLEEYLIPRQKELGIDLSTVKH
mmetsp:Transcript_123444/g.308471  ORF Transcript_123444/g.308471 Transcript_123444/m.308471 type:complete len:564 (-) Transcript_123444:93-1784(-)